MKLKVKSEKLKVQNSKNFDVGKIINRPKGITLIALVITIVVLIILAGVAINLTLGENGIFKRAEEAKQRESESSARERLELILVDARIEKETNASYNSEDYLTQMLEEENITVSGDNVIVDNYNFVIDREKLEILESLGETQIKVTAEVQEYLGKNENDKYEVSMLLTIESNTGLQSVVIQNPDGTTFEMTTEQVKLGKDMEVELDEEYILTVTTKDGTVETRKIVEKSVENIRTAEELAAFRDKVNSGLTYEGKTVSLANDIDLQGSETNQWIPIGTTTTQFEGSFDGNNKTITGLYINTSNIRCVGFFSVASKAIIENLNIENCYINSTWNSTSESGYVYGICTSASSIKHCSVTGEISFIYDDNTTVNTWLLSIGGISGYVGNDGDLSNGEGIVEDCYNGANIKVYVKKTSSSANVVRAGGVVATTNNGTVRNCYNSGNINVTTTSNQKYIFVGGVVAESEGSNSKLILSNSYNIGSIITTIPSGVTPKIGAVFGGNASGTYSNTNSYYLSGCGGNNTYGGTALTATQMKTATFANILNESEAYSNSINWNSEYIANDNYFWNYSNGYPILKWQIGK